MKPGVLPVSGRRFQLCEHGRGPLPGRTANGPQGGRAAEPSAEDACLDACAPGCRLPCVGAPQADVAVSPEAPAAPRTSDWTSARGPLLGRRTHLAVAFGWGGASSLEAVVEGLPRELVRLALEAALPGSCVLGTRGAGRRCATPAPTTSQGAPTPRPHDEQGRSSKARRLGPGCQGGGDSHRRQAHSCAGCPRGWAWSPQRAAVCPLPVSCRPRPVAPPAVLQRL